MTRRQEKLIQGNGYNRQRAETAEECHHIESADHHVEFQLSDFEQRLHWRDRIKSGGAESNSTHQFCRGAGRPTALLSRLDRPTWNKLGNTVHGYRILIVHYSFRR